MKTGDKVVIIMDEDGHLFGKPNYDRWNSAK